jgi:peptidoglycan-associated lipoprotein
MPNLVRRASVVAVLGLTVLGACRKKPAPAVTPVPTTTTTRDTAAERRAQEERDRLARERAAADSAARVASERERMMNEARGALTAAIYFEYDAAEISSEARSILDAKLPLLNANTGLRIRIAGHTDSRGSDEYNLALGQRRAAATKRYLTQRGIDASRIDVVSFGEERPATEGEGDEAFSRNRRAEFEIVSGGEMLTLPAR